MFASRFLALLSALALASGCAGSVTSPVPPGIPASSGDAIGGAVVTVKIPLRFDAEPRPHWVSPSTKRLTIVLNGPTAIRKTTQISPSGPDCVKGKTAIACTLTFSLKPGDYTAMLTTYDTLSGPADPLSEAPGVPFTVVAGRSRTVNLTLDGIPWSIALAPGALSALNTSFDLYGQGAHPFKVLVYDAQNNAIVGPGAPHISAAQTAGKLPYRSQPAVRMVFRRRHRRPTRTQPPQ